MVVTMWCACGERLRWIERRHRYEPLAGSGAPLAGHVVAKIIKGAVEDVLPDRRCTAGER